MKLSDIKKFKLMGSGIKPDWGPGFIKAESYYDKNTFTSYQVFTDYDGRIKFASVTAKNAYEVVAFPKDPKEYKPVEQE